MPEQNALARAVAEFIVTEVASRPPESPLTPEFPIIEAGLVDSLGLFKLIAFIEERWPVRIGPDEILLENFATVGHIVRLVEGKLAFAGGAQAGRAKT